MKQVIIGSLFLAVAASAATAGNIDFSAGIFFVNEDWYGHQNSTVNYLLPDDPEGDFWHYRVVQEANPGRELGCTAQYGAIWDGRMYIIAKQAKDPGAAIEGGRITVCDASTMEILHQSVLIDPSGAQCDGRAFIGIDAHKGYISTSNGVWILDLDTYAISGPIEGTTNGNGSLYLGQCGSMVKAGGHVFVAHQQYGLLVIDAVTDSVISTIAMDIAADGAGIGSVVRSKDGSLWLSAASDVRGSGKSLATLVRVDPLTLAAEAIPLPTGAYGPSNSWYAWTPDSFCASAVTNSLYWSGGANSWFSGTSIYRYHIDTDTVERIIDLNADGENWKLYGCSMRLHPDTDELYMSLNHDFSTPTFIVRRYTASGEKVCDYNMISGYWFPSLPIFPQDKANNSSGVTTVSADGSAPTFRACGNTVTACGLTPGQRFEAYTSSGTVYGTTAADNDGQATLTLSCGIYILRTGPHSMKIAVR